MDIIVGDLNNVEKRMEILNGIANKCNDRIRIGRRIDDESLPIGFKVCNGVRKGSWMSLMKGSPSGKIAFTYNESLSHYVLFNPGDLMDWALMEIEKMKDEREES